MRKCRRCCCMNNNYNCHNMQNQCEAFEDSCNNVSNENQYNETCNCGFDDSSDNVFPSDPMLGQSYVPTQRMSETFKPCIGLKHGTIFPELVSLYSPCDSMRQIEYIENTNMVGKGCNG